MRDLAGRRSDDQGYAMASVLGLMLIGGLIISLMLTATVRSIGTTTATRASVQARSAAEAGIDDVRAMLAGGTCTAGTVTSTDPKYTVTIHPSTTQTADASMTISCPSSSSQSVLLVAKGTASAPGIGDDGGNQRKVEALLVKAASSPTFNKAMFGKQSTTLNTNLKLLDTSVTNSADIFTEGQFTCSTDMVIEGDVYAKQGVLFSSAPCRVAGSVLTEGNFECSAGTTIEGDLYVGGYAVFQSQPCEVRGVVHVAGNVYMPNANTKIGSSLIAGGSLEVKGLPATTTTNITLGGSLTGTESYITAVRSSWGARVQEHQTVAAPPKYPVDATNAFPRLTAEDPSITTGFQARSWTTTVMGAISGGSPSPCTLSWGGSYFPNAIKITQSTRLDTRTECPSGVQMGMGVWFELKADLVIIATSFNMGGDVRFTSGDGLKHSVYIVSPWTSGATNCTATGSAGIRFEWGTWNQDPKIAALLYSAKPLEIVTKPSIYGQAYGCTLSLSTNTTFYYSPVGAAADPSGAPWNLSYVRDRG